MQQAVGDTRAIPTVVRLSFYIGRRCVLGAVLWTIVTTKEYPPEDMEAFRQTKAEKTGLSRECARDSVAPSREMPETMRKLAPVQLLHMAGACSACGSISRSRWRTTFSARPIQTRRYTRRAWSGAAICFAVYSVGLLRVFVCFCPDWRGSSAARHTHSLCLLCGALGLMSVAVIHDKYMLLLTMVGVGIAWASTLSMPYAVLAASLPPARTGVYMGIFNFFIVTPEILASLFFGWIMIHLLNNNRIYAIIAGGVFHDDCSRPDAASARSTNAERAGRVES